MANFIELELNVQQLLDKRVAFARGVFETLLADLASGGPSKRLHVTEAHVGRRLIELGRLLLAVWLIARRPRRVPEVILSSHGRCAYTGVSREVVRTRFGELEVPMPVYLQHRRTGPVQVSPFDHEIGLVAGRMSLNVHTMAAYLAARMPFDQVIDVWNQFGGYVPSKRSILGIVDQLGPVARACLNDLPAPEGDGEVLVCQVDCGAPGFIAQETHDKRCKPHKKRPKDDTGATSERVRRRKQRQENPQPRKAKGDHSKNGHPAALAVVYTLRRCEDGTWEGPINRRILGTLAGLKPLFVLLVAEATQRGYGTKKTVFLSDGDKGIAALRDKHFPEATPCIDWYHVCEYVWKAGMTGFEEGSKELAAWVHERKEELRAGKIDDVLAAIDALAAKIGKSGPGTKGRRKRLATSRNYIAKRRGQLRYAELLAEGLDISTGAIEGAVKHVIRARLDGSGMRWSPERAEHVLALRLTLVNGEWARLEQRLADNLDHADLRIPPLAPIGPRSVDIKVLRPAA